MEEREAVRIATAFLVANEGLPFAPVRAAHLSGRLADIDLGDEWIVTFAPEGRPFDPEWDEVAVIVDSLTGAAEFHRRL